MAEPKILFLDIETFPIIADVWGMFEQNALAAREYTSICAFSAKWYKGSKTTKALPDYSDYRLDTRTDRAIVQELRDLMDQADIVVAHNGNAFDIKTINSRIIYHSFLPPSPFQSVDTKNAAKRAFRFPSNSLDNLAKYFGFGSKDNTGGFQLWQQCMAGNLSAWNKMKKYNAKDVELLEKLYLRLRPWMTDHPNVTLFTNRPSCPKCSTGKLHSRGEYVSKSRVYQRFQCQSCGGWSRTTKSVKGASHASL